MRVVALLTTTFLVTTAVACGEDEGSSPDPSSLQGIPWVLASGVSVEGWEEAAPSATFEGGTVAGSTGCNRFTASYTADGDALEIGQVAATRRACPPPADAVEREYLAALERVTAWRSQKGALVLLDDDETEVLRFLAATPVGSWKATAFLHGNAVSSPIAGTELTATFGEDGTLSGSGGCNTYRATYTANRGRIEIGEPAATKKACASPEGIMEQEAAYLAALPTAASYSVEGRSLQLLTDTGTIVATYMRAP
jgi:heat shock protein HslJ